MIATASYARFNGFRDNDNTVQQGPVAGLPADEGIATSTGPDIKKFSSEIRFVSKRIGPVEYLAGFFFTDEHNGIPFAKKAEPAPAPKPPVIVQRVVEQKEPAKPKRVVEVFRGDKHIQETF